MELLFLGTGASAAHAMKEGEVTPGTPRCSALLVDKNILIDVPLQTYDFSVKLQEDPSLVTDIFLTHSHGDHFSKVALMQFASAAKQKINFWCHSGFAPYLTLTEEERKLVNVCPVEAMQQWETGGMKVTALPANHLVAPRPEEQPLHYIFEKDGKALFYGCDGGWFQAKTWEHLRKREPLDAIVLDATEGDHDGSFRMGTHNTIPMLRLINAALLENKILKEDNVRVASHIGPNLHEEDYPERLAAIGMITAYDGMRMDV